MNAEAVALARKKLDRAGAHAERVLNTTLDGSSVLYACVLFCDASTDKNDLTEMGLVSNVDPHALVQLLRDFADQLEAKL